MKDKVEHFVRLLQFTEQNGFVVHKLPPDALESIRTQLREPHALLFRGIQEFWVDLNNPTVISVLAGRYSHDSGSKDPLADEYRDEVSITEAFLDLAIERLRPFARDRIVEELTTGMKVQFDALAKAKMEELGL